MNGRLLIQERATKQPYPLFEQLCDLCFVLLQFILHLREPSNRELLPVVRTELLQLSFSLACTNTETEEISIIEKDQEKALKHALCVRIGV